MEIVFAMNRSLVNKIVTVLLLDEALEDEDDSHSTRGKTRKWMKRRHRQRFHNNLVKELLAEDTRTYEEMMRMPRATFLAILSAIEAEITPKNKVGGTEPVSAEERLTIAIRFFATGETFVSMEKQFRVSQRAISYITLEVSSAIIRHLGPTYLKAPNSPEEWRQIAQTFETRWQFPLCLGVIDGKHVAIRPPANSGSWYFNYKKAFSIILMAIAGPDYECLYADIGTNGRVHDGGVWNKCSFKEIIDNGEIKFPPLDCY